MSRFCPGRRRWRGGTLLGLLSVFGSSQMAAQGGVTQGPSRSSWLLTTTGDFSVDNNVLYAPKPEAVSDQISRLNSSLRVVRARARSSVELQASGSALFYQKLPRLNLFAWDVTGSGSRRVSANTGASATAFYRNLLTSDARVTASPTVLLLRRAIQRSLGGSVAVGRRLTPFTNAGLTASVTNVTFSGEGFIPGTAFNGGGAIRHQFRRLGSAGILLGVEQGSAQGIPLAAQSLSAEWGSIIKKIRLVATAGVTRSANGPVARFLATGGVQASDSIAFGSLSVGYSRSVSQAFGLGTLLETDAFSASYDFQALRGNFVTASAFIGESRLSTGGSSLRSRGYSLGMRRVLLSGLTAGGGASYRQRKDVVEASGFGASLGVGYTFPNGR